MNSTIRPPVHWKVLSLSLAGFLAFTFCLFGMNSHAESPTTRSPSSPPATATTQEPTTVEYPQAMWKAAGITMAPAEAGTFTESVSLTGKIGLNEDKLAHLFPMVEGRADEVLAHLGQHVKKGELLLVVQSREVGQGMLQLFQDRLKLKFAETRFRWVKSVAENTQQLIDLIREGTSVDDIETKLKDRPMGENRERLMASYIAYYQAEKNLQRLAPLQQDGVVPARQILEAETQRSACRASLQSLTEQVSQDVIQSTALAAQTVKELETSIAVSETNLKILGFTEEELRDIDPARQGEQIAHYPVIAPFDGTVISKDVALLERVGPDKQIFTVADLSSVWVTADIYEENLPLLNDLQQQTIYLRSHALPNHRFEAKVFYTGDVVQESTRTIALRAVAPNPDGLLKPGMFVNIEFPSLLDAQVLRIPRTAIQDHGGKSFVFVHTKGEEFQIRAIERGRHNGEWVEILSGLRPGEEVVVSGGFALKTRMLSDLLE